MLVVYWIEPETRQAHYEEFGDGNEDLRKSLDLSFKLRADGKLCVTTTYHTPGAGGIVRDGKLPNGEPYTWKKRR